jgi:MFS family permease
MSATTARSGTDMQVISLIGGAHFLSHFFIFAMAPLMPILHRELGVSFLALGAVMTTFQVTSGLSQLPIGFVVDRLGARKILIMGVVVESLAFLAIGLTGTYWALLVFFAIAGVANSVYHPADYTILTRRIGGQRMGRAFSLHTFAGYSGGAAAPPFFGAVAGLWSWQTAFIATGIIGLGVGVLLILFGSMLEMEVAKPTGDRAGTPAKPENLSAREGIRLLLSPPVMLCFVFFLMIAMSSSGLNSFAVAALIEVHGTPFDQATMALTGFLIGGSLGILAGGFIADRTRHHELVAMAGFGATAIVVYSIGVVAMPGLLLIAVFTTGGLLYGMIMPSRDMMVRRVTPDGSMGKVFGFVSVGLNIGAAIMPILMGWVMDNSDPIWIFHIAAGVMVLALLITLLGRLVQKA